MAVIEVYRVEGAPGRRVTVLGARVHHGLCGVVLLGVGIALALHDRRDWPWSIRAR